MELLPDAPRWRSEFAELTETYRTHGVMPAMAKFGSLVEEGGPRYSEEPPTPEAQEMINRMPGNFELFIAHEIRQIVAYTPDVDALANLTTRIVSAAGENSEQQAARRAAIALAERLGIPVTYLPGAHGGRGQTHRSSPRNCASRFGPPTRPRRPCFCRPLHKAAMSVADPCELERQLRLRPTASAG